MRKGLWSPDEDERLVRCITKYVNGSWSDIARKAGLDRCGKSCRRRWMNHLRPDLKRGKFSMDEINLIVQLQEALGNRWSDIASHLEGRTDNDVKNLWNTQIKKRLSQLKAQNLSSVPINFSSNTHGACSTNNNVDLNMGDLTNMGFLPSTIDDQYENGNVVLRFGGGSHGNMEYNSCSASSCEGSDQLNLNDQENSSWKPSINIMRSALNLSHADLKPPKINDSNNFLWSNMQGNDHQMLHNHHAEAKFTTAEHNDYDHSLLMRPCCSSSNLMSSGISFLQPSQLPLHERAVASCVGDLFDLQYQESHQACTTTIASLESSSYVPPRTDSCALADDNEECCSLQLLRTIPSTFNHVPELQNQITKNGISTIDNVLSATATTINCNPLSKIVHNYNDDQQQILQQRTLQCSPRNENVSVSMNEKIYKAGGDNRGITTINEPAAAGLGPANVINPNSDQDQSLYWGEGQNQDPHQLQSNYVNMQGAGVGGWDYTSECSNILPHFSFADWCKHLLQMSTDLL